MNIELQLLIKSSPKLSSVKMADMLGRTHSNVKIALQRRSDKLKEAGVLKEVDDLRYYVDSYKGNNGQVNECYNLPRYACGRFTASFPDKDRRIINDYWRDLERGEKAEGSVTSDEPTLSSRDIADFTCKPHVVVLPILRRAMEELGIDPAPFRFVSGRGIVIYRIPLSKCEEVLAKCGYREAWLADISRKAAVKATEEEVVPPDDVAEAPAPTASAGQTMSSVVIAKLCGRSHNNVLRSIRGTLRAHRLDPQDFEGKYKGANNQLKPCYNLPRDKTWLVVEKYPGNAVKRIMQLWDEMEGKPAKVDFDPHTTEEIPSSTPGVRLGQGVCAGDYTDVVPADPDDAGDEGSWQGKTDEEHRAESGEDRFIDVRDSLVESCDGTAVSKAKTIKGFDYIDRLYLNRDKVESEAPYGSVPSDVDLTTWGVKVDDMIKDRKAATQSGAFTREQVEYFRRVKEMQPAEVTPPTTADSPVVVPFDKDNVPDVWPPVAGGQVKTMSSLDIAELTGKRHDHVMRDIRTTLGEAGIDAPKFGGTYVDVQNNERPCYHLPRFECDLVVSGYSVKYRSAIIRRWHELEAKEASSTPELLIGAIEQLVEQARKGQEAILKLEKKEQLIKTCIEQIEARDAQVAAWAPAVKAHDKFLVEGDNLTLTATAKHLGVSRDRLIRECIKRGLIFRRGRDLVAYAEYEVNEKGGKGYFTYKHGMAQTGHEYDNLRVTPKGQSFMATDLDLS